MVGTCSVLSVRPTARFAAMLLARYRFVPVVTFMQAKGLCGYAAY